MLTMSHVVFFVCLITYTQNGTPCGRVEVITKPTKTRQRPTFRRGRRPSRRGARQGRGNARAQGWPWTSAPQRRSACVRSGATPRCWRPREVSRCAFAPHGAAEPSAEPSLLRHALAAHRCCVCRRCTAAAPQPAQCAPHRLPLRLPAGARLSSGRRRAEGPFSEGPAGAAEQREDVRDVPGDGHRQAPVRLPRHGRAVRGVQRCEGRRRRRRRGRRGGKGSGRVAT